MEVIAGNKLRIKKPTKDVVEFCRTHLVIDNPDFHKKERMGFWTGNTPREILLYERDGEDLILPFGCLRSIYKIAPQASYIANFSDGGALDYHSSINLYPYQLKAVEKAVSRRNGVIVMPCGAGKTQTALEIIARLHKKTLWLTHTQDLLNQSMNRAKSVLAVDPKTYGTITGGKVNIGTGITFATVQTMAKIDLSQYRDTWDVVVVDECHKAVGSPTKCMQFYKVLSSISCRYKYGVTATPYRSDGLSNTMFALLGGVICEVDKTAVKETTCPVEVQYVYTGYTPDMSIALAADGTLNYSQLVDDMIHHENRFKCVFDCIRHLPKGEPVLVLANRVEYLERLEKRYIGIGRKAICLSRLGNSKKAKEIRKRSLKQLNDGEINCILATYQLAKEGLDVPNLRYVVFATPEKDPTTVMQSAGRVARKHEGKQKGIIIDFVDEFGMFNGWKRKREKVYNKMDYQIVEK